jgi:hypothetical protein
MTTDKVDVLLGVPPAVSGVKSKNKPKILVMDSLNSKRRKNYKKVLANLTNCYAQRWIDEFCETTKISREDLGEEAIKWTIQQFSEIDVEICTVPQQPSDSNACGWYTIEFAKYICQAMEVENTNDIKIEFDFNYIKTIISNTRKNLTSKSFHWLSKQTKPHNEEIIGFASNTSPKVSVSSSGGILIEID